MKTISQTISNKTRAFNYDNIPQEVRERARHLMLDAFGIAFASTRFDFSRRTLDGLLALTEGSAGNVPVVGMDTSLPTRDAAIMNGLLIHGLDYDDTHPNGIIHATASAVTAVTALGYTQKASGQDLLTAYVLGIEVATRLGVAARGEFHQVGFHPTGLIGAFGCTAAAGWLLGLTEEQLTHAQGITLSFAAGSMEFLQDGAWTKRIHPGWAAQCAITAATLAKKGFIGPRETYEGRFGLFASHLGQEFELNGLQEDINTIGQTWELMNVAVKPIPACHFTHASADAAAILHKDLALEQIARIVAKVPAGVMKTVCEPVENKKRPANAYEAQFSIPYSVATGLRYGRFGLDALDEAAYTDAATLAIAEKVESVADPEADFPKYYSGEVIVELKDGRTLSHREHINRGADTRPITNEEIVSKFRENAGTVLKAEAIDRIQSLIQNIEKYDARDLLDGMSKGEKK